MLTRALPSEKNALGCPCTPNAFSVFSPTVRLNHISVNAFAAAAEDVMRKRRKVETISSRKYSV